MKTQNLLLIIIIHSHSTYNMIYMYLYLFCKQNILKIQFYMQMKLEKTEHN